MNENEFFTKEELLKLYGLLTEVVINRLNGEPIFEEITNEEVSTIKHKVAKLIGSFK